MNQITFYEIRPEYAIFIRILFSHFILINPRLRGFTSMSNAIDNVFKLIEENDIKFVLLRFTDIQGKEHGVSLPVSLVDEDLFEDGKMFEVLCRGLESDQ